jgi:hypothetical protein
LDAKQYVFIAWAFIMPAVIQNCFTNADLASSVSIKNDKEHCEWVQLQATLIAPILSMSI